MNSIRDLFSGRRQIDRRIEKVIDYYAADEDRLAAEIAEYEATDNVEHYFRRFLETYQAGVTGRQVTEVGIWVSGFYGSGKSSFTKYLGFALDPQRTVQGQPFLELLGDRLQAPDVRALLRSVAKQIPTAVVMLDLGAEQLIESTAAPVANVLYWKVLQSAGYATEKKLAQLELTLEQRGLYEPYRDAYRRQYGGEWEAIHNDPLIGVRRASNILPDILPDDFPERDSFSSLEFEMIDDLRTLTQRMIDIVRRRTGRENILFLLDEAGQYVAGRTSLILNLDGLARNIKELGQGRVWIVATGQQTLTEVVEGAALNSPELGKLRDRFPIAIELDARDIREITYRRLLTKSAEGEGRLRALFNTSGPALLAHTRLTNTTLFKNDPTIKDFVRYYPFLPQHFDVLMELIRVLARSTGGIGLRSVIRVMQDVLVDTGRILPQGEKLADRPVGALACVDDFYKTLRNDIGKLLPHVVAAVDRVERTRGRGLHLRVAQAVGALQPLQNFPRTAENIAALLYPSLGEPSLLESIRQALADLTADKDIGLIEDPQANGYLFLSEKVAPLRQKRSEYAPTRGELDRVRNELLRDLLEPQPATRLEGLKEVKAAVKVGRTLISGGDEDIAFRLEFVSGDAWDEQRKVLLTQTAQQSEFLTTIVWLAQYEDLVENLLIDVAKSEWIARSIEDRKAEDDERQFARAERTAAGRSRETISLRLQEALLDGVFIYRGQPTPVRQLGTSLAAADTKILEQVARKVFHKYGLVNLRPNTDLAAKFLEVERLDRMPADRDPLGLVPRSGTSPRVNLGHPALAETLRAFTVEVDKNGGRWVGKSIQDHFAIPPYGWSKDAVRYLFAALLVAGEIEVHTGGETLKTAGPAAVEALKNTQAFNRVTLGLRGSRPDPEVIDRAALRLEGLFGEQVLPLEDHLSRAVRKHVPILVETVGALPDRLRLLGLAGEGRATDLLQQLTELLRGDASDAPTRLGSPDGQLTLDIEWARRASRALGDGGERDIRSAESLLRELGEIEAVFPDARDEIATDDDLDAIRDILGSDHFYDQLADLRSATRRLNERVREAYARVVDEYRAALRQAQMQIEERSDWAFIGDAERDDILGRLQRVYPIDRHDAPKLADYKRLLIQVRSLPHLVGELEREVEALRQDGETPPVVEPIPGSNGYPVVEATVVGVKLAPVIIRSERELEEWLAMVRRDVLSRLRADTHVEVEA